MVAPAWRNHFLAFDRERFGHKHLTRYYGALGPRSGLRRALMAATKAQATCEELEAGFAIEGLLAAAKGVARAAREAGSLASRAWAACIRRVFDAKRTLCYAKAAAAR